MEDGTADQEEDGAADQVKLEDRRSFKDRKSSVLDVRFGGCMMRRSVGLKERC